MSFEQEWARIRDEAARERIGTRLNQAGGGGGGERLKVTAGVLTKRAEHADRVRANLAKADDAAMKETEQVPDGLKGFASAAAFDTFRTRWQGQMSHLLSVLEEGVAGALRAAATDFTAEDAAQGGNLNEPRI
ncbi:hypothetical protein GCM10027168_59790 [Streptomyces capparidis]